MYGSVSAANTYFSDYFSTEAWDNATTAMKTKALNSASRDVDNLNFVSEKVEEDQQHEWPRKYINNSETPDDIVYATYEQAKAYLEGKEQDAEYEGAIMSSQDFGPVRTTYNRNMNSPVHVRSGILSISAWRLLRPFLRSTRNIELVRG